MSVREGEVFHFMTGRIFSTPEQWMVNIITESDRDGKIFNEKRLELHRLELDQEKSIYQW